MKKYRIGTRELVLIGIIILVGFSISMLSDAFLTSRNLINLLNNNAIMGIMAVGMMMVILTGNIDVSVGAQMAVVSMVCGAYVQATGGKNIFLTLLVSMIAGVILGLMNGFFVSMLGIPAIVVTLGTMNIMRGGLYLATGGHWLENLVGPFNKFANERTFKITNSIYIWLIVMVVTAVFLYKSRFGRNILAVGGNREAARRAGISERNVYLVVFGYLGLLSGLASALYTSKLKIAQPGVGMGSEMQLIAAAVLGGAAFTGGKASILGTFLGILLLGLIENGLVLMRVPVYWQTLATGVIITAAVVSSVFQMKKRTPKTSKQEA